VKLTHFISLWFATSIAFCGEPPAGWKESVLRKDAQSVWDACCDDGRFYPSRLIGLFRTMGSQHDGDRQHDVAELLAQVPDDPSASLKHYLSSPDPYDRVFAIQVIAHLGDRRFLPSLEALNKDTASTNRWDLLAYETVGDGARLAADQIRRGKNWVTPDGPTPKWLQAARSSKHK
jgi:hypothetical protein